MSHKQLEERILDYIEGAMSDADAARFESELETNPELQQSFDAYKEILQTESWLRDESHSLSPSFDVKVMDRIVEAEGNILSRFFRNLSRNQKYLMTSVATLATLVIVVRVGLDSPDRLMDKSSFIEEAPGVLAPEPVLDSAPADLVVPRGVEAQREIQPLEEGIRPEVDQLELMEEEKAVEVYQEPQRSKQIKEKQFDKRKKQPAPLKAEELNRQTGALGADSDGFAPEMPLKRENRASSSREYRGLKEQKWGRSRKLDDDLYSRKSAKPAAEKQRHLGALSGANNMESFDDKAAVEDLLGSKAPNYRYQRGGRPAPVMPPGVRAVPVTVELTPTRGKLPEPGTFVSVLVEYTSNNKPVKKIVIPEVMLVANLGTSQAKAGSKDAEFQEGTERMHIVTLAVNVEQAKELQKARKLGRLKIVALP